MHKRNAKKKKYTSESQWVCMSSSFGLAVKKCKQLDGAAARPTVIVKLSESSFEPN